ncbi:hypothetical protein OKA04_22800 [Luteolibacter flavescens]|uniref:Uncharacterized protein n=1 Tax=Luteolibacter flavescens TaxID=1859460 RepID=A0ABT3FWI1_9BACT|nr:hypothetical protein [Luteolibacter flavescens]MCW1887584.1 hypothetical protein [Luteolibacter flavescens]
MKTPDSPPRFHTTVRHYHRYRSDSRSWDDWTDLERKPGSRWRWLRIAVPVALAVIGVVLLFLYGGS